MADQQLPWATVRVVQDARNPARSVVQVLVGGKPVARLLAASYGVQGTIGAGAPLVTVSMPAVELDVETFDPTPGFARPEPYV